MRSRSPPPEIRRLEELRLAALELAVDAELAAGRHGEVVAELEALVGRAAAARAAAGAADARPVPRGPPGRRARGLPGGPRGAGGASSASSRARSCASSTTRSCSRTPRSSRGRAARRGRAIGAAATGETPRGAFVGRERELAALIAGLDDALAGRGRLFLLVGEPGIGKSRLAEELVAAARRARCAGARRPMLGGGRRAGLLALGAVAACLRARLRDHGAARAARRRRRRTSRRSSPSCASGCPTCPSRPRCEPETARFRLFDAAAGFLRAAAASRPIVLVLDDLHAADTPSLLLLRFLARELARRPRAARRCLPGRRPDPRTAADRAAGRAWRASRRPGGSRSAG